MMEDNKEEYLTSGDITLSLFGLGRELNTSLMYMNPISMNLNGTGNYGDQRQIVPVFNAIYGGYILTGGTYNWLWDKPDYVAARFGSCFIFGQMCGWFDIE